jgi:hypothetical protein
MRGARRLIPDQDRPQAGWLAKFRNRDRAAIDIAPNSSAVMR